VTPRSITAVLAQCPACGSKQRRQVLDLPQLPLTGIYVTEPTTVLPQPDQTLLLCTDCGHGYLENVIDPELLYQETYTHRTGGSPIARSGNDFLWSFIDEVVGTRRFQHAFEIGCNDLYLTQRLTGLASHVTGLDPIWRDRQPEFNTDGIKVLGKFVGELDCSHDLDQAADLIVSAHTFEHVHDPYDQLQPVIDHATDGAFVFIEVPCFDTQLSNFRFDQVFHQHIQYFSVYSMARMIERLGCRYLAHRMNYRYWGGTMLFAFIKESRPRISLGTRPTVDTVAARLGVFRDRYTMLRRELNEFCGPLYAFGAAQMLPIVAYHLHTDMNEFGAILDDNPQRVGRYFPGWRTPIVEPTDCPDIHDAGVVITALDSYRPILRRLLEMDPRTIFWTLCRL